MNADTLIYGATGFTGTLVARALQEQGLDIALAGRDRHRLEELASTLPRPAVARVANVHDEDELRAAMEGCRVVVNCAGPFRQLGEPVVRAAIEGGHHYLDTTGEQAFTRDIYERYEALARRQHVAVVNSCAFEVALGDWLASRAADRLEGEGPVDEISVCYALDQFKTTGGTQLSILAQLAEPGFVWSSSRWEAVAPAAETRLIPFPAPFGRREVISFPSGEVITVPRHIEARRVQTFISVAEDNPTTRLLNRASSLIGPLLPTLVNSPIGAVARSRLAGTRTEPTASQRQATAFAILARAERSFERRHVSVTGTDIYGVSAEIIAAAALRMLEPQFDLAGVLTPSELLDPHASLLQIADRCDLEVDES